MASSRAMPPGDPPIRAIRGIEKPMYCPSQKSVAAIILYIRLFGGKDIAEVIIVV
jgi:hypothetical protein